MFTHCRVRDALVTSAHRVDVSVLRADVVAAGQAGMLDTKETVGPTETSRLGKVLRDEVLDCEHVMRLRVAASVGLTLLVLAGCSSALCTDQHETYKLAGDAPAAAAGCPAVVLVVYEATSSRCLDHGQAVGQTPGSIAFQQNLTSSSSWSVDVPITYVDPQRPSVDVYAYCDHDQNGLDPADTCIGSTSLAPGSHDAVILDGQCPGRL